MTQRQTGSMGDELTNAALIGQIGIFCVGLVLRASGTITASSFADPGHLTYVAYEQGAATPPATDSLPSLAGRHW